MTISNHAAGADHEAAASHHAAEDVPVGKPEPSSARLILTLGVAGLVSGLALVGTYEGTLARIKANDADALRAGVFKVVPGAVKMEKLQLVSGRLQPYQGDDPTEVIAAYDEHGALAGYAIVGEGPGFADMIKLIYGYDPRRQRIVGMQVLASLETPGLGDKIIKDQHFVGCFSNLAVEPEVVAVKPGERSKDNEVDTITGATISAKAVIKIINTANGKWLSKLPAAAGAPQAAAGSATRATTNRTGGER